MAQHNKLTSFILCFLLFVWLFLTVILAYRFGNLSIERNDLKVKLNERTSELSYCLNEIKNLVANGN